ncbi:MAG: hypothetical protein V3V67_04140 [Myxococcota bacterium]
MSERASLQLRLVRGLDELLQAVARASAELRASAEREGSAEGYVRLAELAASCLDRAEGPTLAALRRALRDERLRWEARAADDPSAERVRDLIGLVLDVLEPDPRAGARSKKSRATSSRTQPRERDGADDARDGA